MTSDGDVVMTLSNLSSARYSVIEQPFKSFKDIPPLTVYGTDVPTVDDLARGFSAAVSKVAAVVIAVDKSPLLEPLMHKLD